MKEKIKTIARELGFLSCGFTSTEKLSPSESPLKDWLKSGYHATMNYMENHFEKRLSPNLLVENAKTAIVVLYNYYPQSVQPSDVPQIAKYAYGEDYHHVFKDKLYEFLQRINDEITPVSGRVFTDSAPVLERPLAVRAGLGWQGRNSLLISPHYGSFFFIGELLVDIQLEPDLPFEKNFCGNCRKCIESCPTGAIIKDGVIDSNRCISFWTIEHRGEFNDKTPPLSNRAFGCDICQDVCPWNSKSHPHTESRFHPNPELLTLSNEEWHTLSPEQFNTLFRKSAVKRTKYSGLKRNLTHIMDSVPREPH